MKRVSKKNALFELASALTKCDAHSDESNSSHRLVVHLAYVLWMIYRKDGKLDEMDLSRVKECIYSL